MSEQLAAIMDEHGEYCLRVAYLYVKDWPIAEEICTGCVSRLLSSTALL
ncbi:hypothetical protein [Lysinibacillus parviboronicapiens]|nr:hypothetical protein [Lysinibacillus parviboronicapiens]